jgi:hypothetical protein
MAGSLDNLIMQIAERYLSERHAERHGLVTSYDPKKYMGKVTLQPGGQETGWLRIETGHIGQTYGMAFGLQPGSGQGGAQAGEGSSSAGSSGGTGGAGGSGQGSGKGDQVLVRFQENDLEGGKIASRIHSQDDTPPSPVAAGEFMVWTKFKQDQSPGPDAQPEGQQNSTGQRGWFKKDGSLLVEDGNGASQVLDGKGNYTVTSGNAQQNTTSIVHQVLQDKPASSTDTLGGGVGSLLSGGNIGSLLGGMLGGGSGGGGGSGNDTSSVLSALTSLISSKLGGSGGGSGGIISKLTGLLGGSGLGSLTGLTSLMGNALQQVLHYHKLDRKNGAKLGVFQEQHTTTWNMNGIKVSAFRDQHTTTWDQNGVTHTSGTQVTSTAPKIPHNGQVFNSQDTFTTGKDFASAFPLISDRRLKTNVKDAPSLLDKVMGLKVKTFDKHFVTYSLDGTQAVDKQAPEPSIGLIAQELREVFPDLVHGNEKTGYLSIDSSAVGVLVLAAFQEFVTETRREIDLMKHRHG